MTDPVNAPWLDPRFSEGDRKRIWDRLAEEDTSLRADHAILFDRLTNLTLEEAICKSCPADTDELGLLLSAWEGLPVYLANLLRESEAHPPPPAIHQLLQELMLWLSRMELLENGSLNELGYRVITIFRLTENWQEP